MAATLRAERAAHGLTIADLVRRAGLSKSTVLRLLSGEREVTTSALARLAGAMDVAPSVLMLRAVERLESAAR